MNYSVAEAKNNLPKLIDRALAGEEVKITRRGVVVASLNPTPRPDRGKPVDVAWLRANRITPSRPIDAIALIELMQKEEDERHERLSGR